MRSLPEILFRARQESRNLLLLAHPPACLLQAAPFTPPDVAAVARTDFAGEVLRLADLVLRRRFPLFGTIIETGPNIAWRRDYLHGVESGLAYCRRIPYLDPVRTGDHKIVWELNRHQHLVLLAQAFLLRGRRECLDEIVAQCESWAVANPYLRGINWASALEVAFRALSWTWVDRLAGAELARDFRARFHREIYRHGCYLEQNLSVYFSPNTHLLGEAVALHALGVLYPEWPRARQWERKGAAVVAAEMDRQVRPDGSHFEQSSYYHVYALDFFLLHYLLARGLPASYGEKLGRMAEYLQALIGPARKLPFLGDDDGGRVFHPYGPRELFPRATLATCAAALRRPKWLACTEDRLSQAVWWIGADVRIAPGAPPPARSRVFADSGIAVMTRGGVHALFKTGGMGAGRAGHSHADALSLVVYEGEREILIDPGTYTYVAEPEWRTWFRGAAAHNTIRLDGRDQAAAAGPFAWESKPDIRLLVWQAGPDFDLADAECCYSGFRHRRRVLLTAGGTLFILDEVYGPPGIHLVEQFWHPGRPVAGCGARLFRIGESCVLTLAAGQPELSEGGANGWRSRVFAHRERAPVIQNSTRATLPVRWGAALDFCGNAGPLILDECETELHLRLDGGASAVFGGAGARVLA